MLTKKRGAPCCGDYRQASGVSRTGLTVSISCSPSASFNQVAAIWSKVVLFRRASSRVSTWALVIADDEAGGLFLDGIEFSLLTWRILTWRFCVDAAVNGFRSGGRHGLRREYGLWGRRGLRREYGSWGRHGLRREYGSSRMHGHYPSPAMVAPGCRPAIRNRHLHTLVRVEVCYPQPSAKWQDAACGGELVAVVRRTTGSRTYSVCAKGSLPDHHAPPVSPLLRNRSRRLLLGHARVAMRPIRWGCLLLRTAQ